MLFFDRVVTKQSSLWSCLCFSILSHMYVMQQALFWTNFAWYQQMIGHGYNNRDAALILCWRFGDCFFHHHQELKPMPLSQNVLKFLKMSINNVKKKSSQILRSLSSWEYCWVCCSFHFSLKVLSKRWLKLSSAVLLDKIFWQISGILEVLLKLHCLFVTIKKQSPNWNTEREPQPQRYGCVALPWHFDFYILKCKNFKM